MLDEVRMNMPMIPTARLMGMIRRPARTRRRVRPVLVEHLHDAGGRDTLMMTARSADEPEQQR